MSYTTLNGKLVSTSKKNSIPARRSAAPTIHPDKGIKNGRCNVTACQKPGAIYYNKSTQKYYCEECADRINCPGGRADTMKLYGTSLVCELDEEENK